MPIKKLPINRLIRDLTSNAVAGTPILAISEDMNCLPPGDMDITPVKFTITGGVESLVTNL